MEQQIDRYLLHRQFGKAREMLLSNPDLLKDGYYELIKYKLDRLVDVGESRLLSTDEFAHILQEIKERFNYSLQNPLLIDIESQIFQLFEFVDVDDLQSMEQLVYDMEVSYSSFGIYLHCCGRKDVGLSRKVSYLESIYKLLQSPRQQRNVNVLEELLVWKGYLLQVLGEVKRDSVYYSILRKPMKQLFILSVNQVIHLLFQKPRLSAAELVETLLRVLKNDLNFELLNSGTKINILYSIGKVIFPLVEFSGEDATTIGNAWSVMSIVVGSSVKLGEPILKTWNELFICLMLCILNEIDFQTKQQFKAQEEDATHIELPFVDQLWFYVSVNFTQKSIRLKQALKKVISHNVFALINLYCVRFAKMQLMFKILEDLLTTPFEDDTLRMKMCISLFVIEDFTKLHQLVQTLLASDRIKDTPFRQVIIDLCCVFTSVYIGKSEESLCFARLNLQEYDQSNSTNILTYDTVLSHLAYAYYNLARSTKYVSEKQSFYAKAFEYLDKSHQANPDNYLIHYNLAKLHAFHGHTDQALQHVKQACLLNKGEINALILHALLYTAKDDNQKALLIIDQISKEYPNKPIIYLIKASILAERYLLNLQRDKEVRAAERISNQLKRFVLKKQQKSKEAQNVIQQLQKALFGIAKQVADNDLGDNFTAEMVKLKTLQSFDVDPLTYINYRNCIFNSLDVLINCEFFDLAYKVLELIDDGNSSNIIERQFYSGYLEEKQKKYPEACAIYEEVLKQDFYHIRSMSKLALLYLKHFTSNPKSVQRAGELLIVASKFDDSHEILLGLALLNQTQGNLVESNQYLLEALQSIKNVPAINYQLVPDRLYG